MSPTVECPDCHRTAVVLNSFTVAGHDGPVEYLRIRCAGTLALLVPAGRVTPRPALVGAPSGR